MIKINFMTSSGETATAELSWQQMQEYADDIDNIMLPINYRPIGGDATFIYGFAVLQKFDAITPIRIKANISLCGITQNLTLSNGVSLPDWTLTKPMFDNMETLTLLPPNGDPLTTLATALNFDVTSGSPFASVLLNNYYKESNRQFSTTKMIMVGY